MRALLGRLRRYLAEPRRQDTLVAVVAAAAVQAFIRRTHERLEELEDQATLAAGLRALEDVATLADLERLRAELAPPGPKGD